MDGICISVSLAPAESSMELMAVRPASRLGNRAGGLPRAAAGCSCRQHDPPLPAPGWPAGLGCDLSLAAGTQPLVLTFFPFSFALV